MDINIESLNVYEINQVIEKEMEHYLEANPYDDSLELAIHFFFFGMQYLKVKLEKTLNP